MKQTQSFKHPHSSWQLFLLLILLFGTAACRAVVETEGENVQATVNAAVSLTVSAQDAFDTNA